MSLTLDYQTIHKTQRQDSINLLEHLSSISVLLQDVREQKRLLREQKYALFAQLHGLSEQQQLLFTQESALLQELRVILAELAFLREQCY